MNDDVVKLPDRLWISVNALAASWTTPEDGPEDWLNNLGRAMLVVQGARRLAEDGFECWYGGTHVMDLHPDDAFGIGMVVPEDEDE